MDILLFDTPERNLLYPFTSIRPVADIRLGIFTIREFWENYFGKKTYTISSPYLQQQYPAAAASEVLLINAAVLPTENFYTALRVLKPNEALVKDGLVLAGKTSRFANWSMEDITPQQFSLIQSLPEPITILQYPWQLFQLNEWALRRDFETITRNRSSAPITSTNQVINAENIFIEEGAKVEYSILNANTGPIYIGKNCEVMEACTIRGPFAMLEGSVLKMGTKIYGATTLGPYCLGGGEIKNSLFLGYSNKAHEGYLGDSVIGEWCNLGAGTTNSNLKNTAATVKPWVKAMKQYLPAGNKCGLLMGDYSCSAIQTAFNTGTITGIGCNIFGTGLTPRYIPDFSWGFDTNKTYELTKALETINNWKGLKNQQLTEAEKNILKHIFEQS